jgi:hypothetical protein
MSIISFHPCQRVPVNCNGMNPADPALAACLTASATMTVAPFIIKLKVIL